jgi:hypothetical protein
MGAAETNGHIALHWVTEALLVVNLPQFVLAYSQ